MVMRAINRKVLRDLRGLRAQTITIALLVACGVALLVSAWSAYRSLKDARDSYYMRHRFADIFADFKRAPADIAAKLESIPGIDVLETRVSIDGLLDIPGLDEPAVGRFLSVPSGKVSRLNQVYLRSGRLPEDADTVEALVHEGFAKANGLQPGTRFSVLIQGRRETLTVAGLGLSPEFVYALSPSAPLPDDRHFGVFWVPTSGLARLAGMSGAFNNVTAALAPGASFGAVRDEIDRILKPFGNRGAYGRDKQVSNMFVNDEIAQQRISGFFMPSIFLGIAAFLIHVIISRLIALHRPQIAALKALGYTNGEISRHYVKLVAAMMTFGTIPGIALGASIGRWTSKMYEGFFRFPSLDFTLSRDAVLYGCLAGTLPGLFGAWSSIRSASRLPPAEAMRPLAPPAFRTISLERWVTRRRLGTAGKMILRNLLRRPLRLATTILGMSFAIAIIITAGFWMDTLDYMITTQFQRLQREDLSVGLLKPISRGGLRDIEDWPGIQKVEGFRILPVRLKYLNRWKELSLTGWASNVTLRQRLDRRLREISLPEDGLLVSRYFEKEWGVRIGDRIEVEPLEGEPKSVKIPVRGFTDDLIGLSSSMRIEELWKTFDEEPAYNFLALKADPRMLNELYVRLKDMPVASGVLLKNSVYGGFRNTLVRMIRITTTILLGFALAIAFGIIYNSIRVSFSERSWEMASLRVMGFDRSYVFRLLAFEAALQVGLSILPGWLIGLGLAHASLAMIHTETFGFPVIVEPSTYAMATAAIFGAFGASTAFVYRISGRLKLADALKSRE